MLSLCLTSSTTLIFILFCFTLIKYNYLVIKILFIMNYLIYIISYLLTILINPGIPERKYYIKYLNNKNIDKHKWKNCRNCNIIVPLELKITHCSDCDICVMEQDHHCPWTGKCIAKYNLKYFYVFVYSLLVYFINIFLTLYCSLYYQSKLRIKK